VACNAAANVKASANNARFVPLRGKADGAVNIVKAPFEVEMEIIKPTAPDSGRWRFDSAQVAKSAWLHFAALAVTGLSVRGVKRQNNPDFN